MITDYNDRISRINKLIDKVSNDRERDLRQYEHTIEGLIEWRNEEYRNKMAVTNNG